MDVVAELQQLPDHWERAPHGTAHWLLRACKRVHLSIRHGSWIVWSQSRHEDERAAYTLADATTIAAELSAYTHESY